MTERPPATLVPQVPKDGGLLLPPHLHGLASGHLLLKKSGSVLVDLWGELVRAVPWPRRWRWSVAAGGRCCASRECEIAGGRCCRSKPGSLPRELAGTDAFLDDERFIAPWRAVCPERLGRPSIPVESLPRPLHLKHRYQLGYETLCRAVSDSLSRRRACRIRLTSPVPQPARLIRLVRAASSEPWNSSTPHCWASRRRTSCCGPQAVCIDTTVVETDIDHPTDADLLKCGVRKPGRRCVGSRLRARPGARPSVIVADLRGAGRLKQISRTLRRRTGQALGEIDRFTGEIATVALAVQQLRPYHQPKPVFRASS